MKKIVFGVTVLTAGMALAGLKIGTVEMLTLVRNHTNYEPNKQLLQSTEKDYTKKVDAIKEELEAIQEEMRKLAESLRNPMLAESAKADLEKKGQSIQQKFVAGQQRLRNEVMRSQQELQDLEGRLLKATTEDLRKRITSYAEENDYDFILDSSAAPYSKPSYDVTPEILKAMGVDPEKAKKPTEKK